MTIQAQHAKANGSTPPQNMHPQAEPGRLTLSQALTDFKGGLASRREEFAPSLPSHIRPERFEQVVMTAVNLNPDLLKADRRSLYNACAKAASDGLLPDGRDGALVVFNTKDGDSWVKKVTWMPMVAGIIKKARQSGEIASMGARIVYQKEIDTDRFKHKVVDGIPKIDHDPILWGERGKPVLVYSFVQFKDGMVDFEFLHADDVAKIRNVSRSKDKGPWKDWEEEMWKKSAIRRHAKRLPISSELFDTISRDDELTEFQHQRAEAETKMLEAAKDQFGGKPQIIDAEPADAEEASALDWALATLAKTAPADVADLRDTIAEQLEEADRAQWEAACDARIEQE